VSAYVTLCQLSIVFGGEPIKFDLDLIGCPILLARVYHLMKSYKEIETTEALQKLENQFIVIEDVHEKFFRILHEPDYDVLLYDVLEKWKVLSAPLEIDYSEYEERFIESRGQGNYYTLLQMFIDTFLLALEGHIDIKHFEQLKNVIEVSLEGYKYSMRWDVFGLFALSHEATVYGIKTITYPGDGNVSITNQTDKSISTAVNRVIECMRNIIPTTKEFDYTFEIERADLGYSGSSIELAFCVAIAKKIRGLETDPYTSLTGRIENLETGEIGKVAKLYNKIEAASKSGIRRVLIPNANTEINDIEGKFPGIEIIPISTVSGAIQALEDRPFLNSLSIKTNLFKAKVKKLIICLKAQDIFHLPEKDKPLDGGVQL
jgi:hypothetical protein